MILKDIIEGVSFKDAIQEATTVRHELRDVMETVQIPGIDFESDLEPERPQPAKPEPNPDFNPEYDAEANAQALVGMLNAVDSMLLTGAVHLKCRAKAGGGSALKEMRKAITKEIKGEELTDHDKTLIGKMKEYEARLKILSGEIFPSDTERENLIKMAIPYCEATQLEVGKGFAFWINYAGSIGGRIIKIMSA